MSQSIGNKLKRKWLEKQNDTIFEAFGNYVAKALAELDSFTSSLAQNMINNIFQAQAVLLTKEMQTPRIVQPQKYYFQPIIQPSIATSPQPPIYEENGWSQLNTASSWQAQGLILALTLHIFLYN